MLMCPCDSAAMMAHCVKAIVFGADDLQIHGAGVAMFVQHTQVADQIDVATAVCLHLRLSGVLLAAFAVADVYVLDTGDDRRDRIDRISLACQICEGPYRCRSRRLNGFP